MPFLGLDAVFQCDAENCSNTARVRLGQDASGPPSMMEVMVGLIAEGFEADGKGLVCWYHGWRRRNGAPEPAPALHEQKT